MKAETNAGYTGAQLELIAKAEAASRAIPPLWPLASSVAVNPYLGQTGKSLAETAALLERVGGIAMTMPRDWYKAQISDGAISDADLDEARKVTTGGLAFEIAELKEAAGRTRAPIKALPTVADLAAQVSGIDWPGIIAERIGSWAAGYFDKGQALWQHAPGRTAFDSWRDFASRDLTPEIAGLRGFAARVAATPGQARTALAAIGDSMALSPEMAATYFHQLLLELGGWSQVARYRLWQAELAEGTDTTTTEMLTIRLLWEEALFAQYQDHFAADWAEVFEGHAAPLAPQADHIIDAILQEAAERAAQRKIAQTFADAVSEPHTGRPALQAAFCIDVRSEVFRRALETLDPGIRTAGFAGFFGLKAAHQGFASDTVENRLPVLLTPGLTSATVSDAEADLSARYAARAARAWGRFKLAAVSSFAFVEAAGPLYLGKLLRDALGLDAAQAPDSRTPQIDPAMTLADRIAAAEAILRAMSMTRDFAPLVLLVGHGANVVNNPHASALHCGACGGYSGEVNARLLAGLLNDAAVRNGVAKKGISIPEDTIFLGALHDTTTDDITLYHGDLATVPDLGKVREWLAAAGKLARTERALRLPRAAGGASVPARARDWAETRPEWALAGCQAFVAAPRGQTRAKSLAGRAFLHDYDWHADEGFGVLELIMTAPVVVASWISLQYYGSVVAPQTFGAGNKLLHNVTGGLGVVEGNGGVLRGGLPWQSVHDGRSFAHQPLRLTVCIGAPQEAMSDILARHPQVRALFDNRWLHLIQLDESGKMAARYDGELTWSPMPVQEEALVAAA